MHIASSLRVGFWWHQNHCKDPIHDSGESFDVIISKHLIKLFKKNTYINIVVQGSLSTCLLNN
jgi:hypothetical protein